MLSNATNQPKSTVELGYKCPRGLSGPNITLDGFNYGAKPDLRYAWIFRMKLGTWVCHMNTQIRFEFGSSRTILDQKCPLDSEKFL